MLFHPKKERVLGFYTPFRHEAVLHDEHLLSGRDDIDARFDVDRVRYEKVELAC
jgi:hypothetical protein